MIWKLFTSDDRSIHYFCGGILPFPMLLHWLHTFCIYCLCFLFWKNTKHSEALFNCMFWCHVGIINITGESGIDNKCHVFQVAPVFMAPLNWIQNWIILGGVFFQGSQSLWNSGKTLKMRFHFSSQGKLREHKIRENSGNLTVAQKGKVSPSLGYVQIVPRVQLVSMDQYCWLSISPTPGATEFSDRATSICPGHASTGYKLTIQSGFLNQCSKYTRAAFFLPMPWASRTQ